MNIKKLSFVGLLARIAGRTIPHAPELVSVERTTDLGAAKPVRSIPRSARTIALIAGASASTFLSGVAVADPATNAASFNQAAPGAIATTVPDGICSAVTVVRGGAGASSPAASGTGTAGLGGGGAIISSTFKVLPQQAVTGNVAGGGTVTSAIGGTSFGGTGTAAGGNGGTITAPTGSQHRGGGGGGSSSISIANIPIVIAGGGGGGSAAHQTGGAGGAGGFSGIAAGVVAPGVAGVDGSQSGGGTVGAGAGGGAGGGVGGVNSLSAAANGFAGSGVGIGTGGNGGLDADIDSAGGGGGGYTGGGGGASTVSSTATGAGGGGGSSFVAATSPVVSGGAPTATGSAGAATAAAAGTGVNGAAGLVSIDWVPCVYTLGVTKSVSASIVNAGGKVVWTVAIKNNGPDPMTRGDTVSLADTLPAGPNGAPTPAFKVLSVSTSGGSDANLDSGAVSCSGVTVGSAMPATTVCSRAYSASAAPGAPSGGVRGLNSGETLTITYEQVIANTAPAATITNVASTVDRSSTSGTTDIIGVNAPRSGNAALTIAPYDLEVVKTVSSSVATANSVLTWTVVVTNKGPGDMKGPNDTAANPLIVTDAAPTANVSAPTGFMATGPAGACTYTSPTISCANGLASGAAETFTFNQTVNAAAPSGATISNTANVTDALTGDTNDSSSASATVPATKITVTKISNGGVGTFNFTGTNGFGSDAITTVTSGVGVTGIAKTLTTASTATMVSETIPFGYDVSAISCSGLGSGGIATPNLAGGSVALDAAATAAGSAIACTFTNTKLTPLLAVSKAAPTPGLTVGSNSTYILTVTNNGTAPATTAQVKDLLPTGMTLVSATGTNWACANASGTITCNFSGSSIATGGSTSTIAVVVSPPAVLGGTSVTNYASIDPTGGATPPTPGSSCSPAASCASVGPNPIMPSAVVATPDSVTGVNGATGAANVLNAFTGDTINGAAASPANAILSLATGSTVPSGLTFDPATGNVSVAAGTPSGTYTFDYTICEKLNPTNCKTATESVTVSAAPVVATPDSVTGVNGATGAANVLNAFTGDTINGAPATAANAILSLAAGSTVPSGLTFDPATGNTSVAAGTPAGTYTFNYQICERLNPTNCKVAAETVTVASAAVVATPDSVTGVNGATGAANVLNAFTGDTINGAAASPANAILSLATGSTVPSGLTFDPATGNVSVAAGTPSGTYTFDYTICEKLNPTNCKTATESVTVSAAPVVATPDSVTGVNGATGAANVLNAFTGDTINGAPATAANAILSLAAGSTVPSGLTFDPATGNTSVAAGTPAGTYTG